MLRSITVQEYKAKIHEAAAKDFSVHRENHAVPGAGLQRGQEGTPVGHEQKGQQGQSGAWDQWKRNLGVPYPAHPELPNWTN